MKLKEIRIKLMYSQAELGKLLGVNYNTIARWELGNNAPRMAQKRKIVEFCEKNGIKKEEIEWK